MIEAPPPPRVHRPVMHQEWNQLSFVHWRYPAETVQALLPDGLEVETYDGSAWIGLVPFLMQGVRPPVLPAAPWLSAFPETNVRTYVRDRRGRSGIWFFSLDAARLPAVLTARSSYALPYFWSRMRVEVDGDRISYRSRRRWPGPRGARADVEVRLGPLLTESEADPLAHFLTARYRLFSVIAGRLVAAEAEHPPWPLHRLDLLRLEENLLTAAGLPAPRGEPLGHASPGVRVRIGMWHP
ncbi:YqjF family protein [Plantactinospora sp. WMMC1484]|uniref:YqjF family protein n=1 Tax=Plantactinospora sp. WMMC1484 TaxID=3404122 RepID=UPI003BF60264